jgi:hypothetical protein
MFYEKNDKYRSVKIRQNRSWLPRRQYLVLLQKLIDISNIPITRKKIPLSYSQEKPLKNPVSINFLFFHYPFRKDQA